MDFRDNPWDSCSPEVLLGLLLVGILFLLVLGHIDVFNGFFGVPCDVEVSGHDESADPVGVHLGHVSDEFIIIVAEIVFFHGIDEVKGVGDNWHDVCSNVVEPSFMSPACIFIGEAPVNHGVSGLLELAGIGLLVMNVEHCGTSGLVFFVGNAPEVVMHLVSNIFNWAPSIMHPVTEALVSDWALIEIIESSNKRGLVSLTHEFSHENGILVGFWFSITGLLDRFTEEWFVDFVNHSNLDVMFVVVAPVASRDTGGGEGSERKLH